jgi:hypothetical protein
LVVPINTVASEFFFNAGGRVIEPYRASLSLETIRMLLYGSDWVRALHGLKRKHVDEEKVSSVYNLYLDYLMFLLNYIYV